MLQRGQNCYKDSHSAMFFSHVATQFLLELSFALIPSFWVIGPSLHIYVCVSLLVIDGVHYLLDHPESMKRAIIKGFSDRARALCDEEHREDELHNFEDVFVASGYPRETVRRFMEQKLQQVDKREKEEQENRGVVTIPYLKGLSEQFRRTAYRHSFRVAFKPGRKVKEFKRTCREPLGEKQKCFVYRIPCCNLERLPLWKARLV